MTDVKPRIKLDKKEAKQGELVEVKALVDPRMKVEIECQAYVE